jgi:tRNA pseudouridine13 synthase
MTSIIVHEREQDDGDVERYSKRTRIEGPEGSEEKLVDAPEEPTEAPHVLPPSHALLGVPLPVAQDDAPMNFMETNVGISEYIGRGVYKIEGIIKQRSDNLLHFTLLKGSSSIRSLDLRISLYMRWTLMATLFTLNPSINP